MEQDGRPFVHLMKTPRQLNARTLCPLAGFRVEHDGPEALEITAEIESAPDHFDRGAIADHHHHRRKDGATDPKPAVQPNVAAAGQ